VTARHLDLDQRRAEAGREKVDVTINGEVYSFAPQLPVSIGLQASRLSGGDLSPVEQEQAFMAVCNAMVGADRAGALVEAIDFEELMWLMTEVYGVDLGESQASAPSSPNGGTQPRPT
jgi:hypothetical protein